MEPAFKVNGKYTEEEYVRFMRFLVRGQGRGRRSFIIWLCVFSAWLLLSLILYWDVVSVLIPLACLALYLWTMTIGLDRRLRRNFRKNKLQANLEYELSFFDDHYEGVASTGTDNIPYEKMHKILETPTNIYLLLTPGQGSILRKDDLPEGALEFLRKVKETYKL
jgi:hypothetical protein